LINAFSEYYLLGAVGEEEKWRARRLVGVVFPLSAAGWDRKWCDEGSGR
jgi:hypothetical protein